MNTSNFTGEIKKELVRNGFENACCKTAALSAFLRTAGSIVRKGNRIGFEFVTENETVAEFFIGLIEELYGAQLNIVQAKTDIRNGKDRLIFECLSDESAFILKELGIAEWNGDEFGFRMDLDKYIVENECCEVAYIAGAFLGSGSCSVPKGEDSHSGYHLEIVFSNGFLADDFCELLAVREILAKKVARKGSLVVYLKSRGSISDFLDLIGAHTALAKLDALSERRDERNQINRVANCLQKNYDKSILASVRQIQAIEQIDKIVGLAELDPVLRQTAQARIADKEASLKELAENLHISKSCLNHRLRKIENLAKELGGE